MRTLLRKRTPEPAEAPALGAAPEAEAPPSANGAGAPAPAAEPAAAECRTCGAPMLAGQDWCLECGTAAPGRLGQRPGWRLGAVVLGLTLLLVGGASVAGYAAVTGDAERQTAAQSTDPGTPVPAQVAQVPAPAKPTSQPKTIEAPPATSTPSDTASDIQPVAPVDDSTTIDPVTPVPDTTDNTTTTPTTDDATGGTTAAEPFTIKDDNLFVYDPYKRPGAEFGDPADALNKNEPYFDVTVPADNEDIGAGLKVDLGAVRQVTQITFRTTTPGMGLQIYGLASGDPNGLKAGWRLLKEPDLSSDERDVTVDFDGDGVKVRRLVFFFTTPAKADDPRASLGRLQVLG